MSWPVVLLGWIACLINMLSHVLLGLPYHKWFGLFVINSGRIHWQNGTNFIEGGLASNLWIQGPVTSRGAYTDGCFGFFHGLTIMPVLAAPAPPVPTPTFPAIPGTLPIVLTGGTAITLRLMEHESGHNLNLSAFGVYFALINMVDENAPLGGQAPRLRNAYGERLAESNQLNTARDILPMWR